MNQNAESALDVVVVPRTHDLGDQFIVRRALPSRQRRMVGPFVFLDQMGPYVFSAGHGLDVRPHPHIGLATVTYLLDGEIMHRDSLGTVQSIRPGAVNWMNAGSGIVHSERTAPQQRQAGSNLFGLQCWVALPRELEESAPGFSHTPASELPVIEGEGATARVIAGQFFGQSSPAPASSPLFYVDLQLQRGARLAMPAQYTDDGALDLGRDGNFGAGQLLVLKPGATLTLAAGGGAGARVMLLGGEPMDGPRYLAWNFVSSSRDRIEQAKTDWKAQAFPSVPDETEFIPLPDLPDASATPVDYP